MKRQFAVAVALSLALTSTSAVSPSASVSQATESDSSSGLAFPSLDLPKLKIGPYEVDPVMVAGAAAGLVGLIGIIVAISNAGDGSSQGSSGKSSKDAATEVRPAKPQPSLSTPVETRSTRPVSSSTATSEENLPQPSEVPAEPELEGNEEKELRKLWRVPDDNSISVDPSGKNITVSGRGYVEFAGRKIELADPAAPVSATVHELEGAPLEALEPLLRKGVVVPPMDLKADERVVSEGAKITFAFEEPIGPEAIPGILHYKDELGFWNAEETHVSDDRRELTATVYEFSPFTAAFTDSWTGGSAEDAHNMLRDNLSKALDLSNLGVTDIRRPSAAQGLARLRHGVAAPDCSPESATKLDPSHEYFTRVPAWLKQPEDFFLAPNEEDAFFKHCVLTERTGVRVKDETLILKINATTAAPVSLDITAADYRVEGRDGEKFSWDQLTLKNILVPTPKDSPGRVWLEPGKTTVIRFPAERNMQRGIQLRYNVDDDLFTDMFMGELVSSVIPSFSKLVIAINPDELTKVPQHARTIKHCGDILGPRNVFDDDGTPLTIDALVQGSRGVLNHECMSDLFGATKDIISDAVTTGAKFGKAAKELAGTAVGLFIDAPLLLGKQDAYLHQVENGRSRSFFLSPDTIDNIVSDPKNPSLPKPLEGIKIGGFDLNEIELPEGDETKTYSQEIPPMEVDPSAFSETLYVRDLRLPSHAEPFVEGAQSGSVRWIEFTYHENVSVWDPTVKYPTSGTYIDTYLAAYTLNGELIALTPLHEIADKAIRGPLAVTELCVRNEPESPTHGDFEIFWKAGPLINPDDWYWEHYDVTEKNPEVGSRTFRFTDEFEVQQDEAIFRPSSDVVDPSNSRHHWSIEERCEPIYSSITG